MLGACLGPWREPPELKAPRVLIRFGPLGFPIREAGHRTPGSGCDPRTGPSRPWSSSPLWRSAPLPRRPDSCWPTRGTPRRARPGRLNHFFIGSQSGGTSPVIQDRGRLGSPVLELGFQAQGFQGGRECLKRRQINSPSTAARPGVRPGPGRPQTSRSPARPQRSSPSVGQEAAPLGRDPLLLLLAQALPFGPTRALAQSLPLPFAPLLLALSPVWPQPRGIFSPFEPDSPALASRRFGRQPKRPEQEGSL